MHLRIPRFAPLLTGLALTGLVVLACTADARTTPTESASPAGASPEQPTGEASTKGGAAVGAPEPAVSTGSTAQGASTAPGYASVPRGYQTAPAYPNGGRPASGIWVAGTGEVTVAPDLAILNVGVEAREDTVEAARESAARAMEEIIAALKEHDIRDEDIRTRYFNVSPIRVYREKTENGSQYREPEIVGYRVNNQATVKIRDLDSVGVIVDEATMAGGDLVRINGITFTVEDPGQFTDQAREAAVEDAVHKAEQFASLTDATLGKLVYITETGGTPAPRVYAEAAMARADEGGAITPISEGEQQVTVSVQAVFAIR